MNKLLTKRIIIISSNDEKVGTQSDVKNYIKFFTSPFGGCWDEKEEIKKIYKLDDLQRELIIAHCIQCEYIICIFTGHGRWNGASTELKLASGEIIDEKHLHGLAAWQLTILDCCRKAGEAPRGLVKNVDMKCPRKTRKKFGQNTTDLFVKLRLTVNIVCMPVVEAKGRTDFQNSAAYFPVIL